MARFWGFFRGLPWLVQLAFVVAAGWLLYYLFQQIKGLFEDRTRVKRSDLPESWDPDPLAKDLYQCMKGANLWACTEQWTKLANLRTDAEVASVYNHFNKHYGEGSNLKEWIQGEYSLGDTTAKNAALARLNKVT